MAEEKISALPAATAVGTTDTIPIVQGGTTKKATVALSRTAPSATDVLQLQSSGTYYPVQVGETNSSVITNIEEFHSSPAVAGGEVTPTDFLVTPKAFSTNGWAGITILGSTSKAWPYLEFLGGRGTLATPTAVTTGDLVGELAYIAANGAGHYRVAALIDCRAIGTIGGSNVPGQLEFTITNTSGTFSQAAPNLIMTAAGLSILTGVAATEALDITGNIKVSGTINGSTIPASTSIGYLDVPINSQNAGYTLALTDRGKCISMATAGTFTIPANGTIAFPVGSVVSFFNATTVSTIPITSDTLILAGTATTGTRTLAANGFATALKVAATTWVISGTGLS